MLLSLLIGIIFLFLVIIALGALSILLLITFQFTKNTKKGFLYHAKKELITLKKEIHVFAGVLKKGFSDVKIPLKNFIHWNISKLLVRAGGLLLGFVLGLPFLLLLLVFGYLDSIQWLQILSPSNETLDIMILSAVSNNLGVVIFEACFLITFFTFLILGWSYAGILQLNVYRHYFLGEKLPYKKNFYFDIQKYIKYSQVLGWMGVWLCIPIGVFAVLTLILYFIFINIYGGFENFKNVLLLTGANGFSVSEFIVAVLCIIALVYIVSRVIFASYVFVESFDGKAKLHPAKWYVHTSFELTKGVKYFLRVCIYTFIFAFVIGFFSLPEDYVTSKGDEMNDYLQFSTASGVTLDSIEDPDVQEYYANLVHTYQEYPPEKFISQYKFYGLLETILGIISFLVLEGLIEMALYSFYRNALKK